MDSLPKAEKYVLCPYCDMWYDINSSNPHNHGKVDYVGGNVNVVIDYRDKLDRIIKLLESIEYQLRTR